MSNPFRVTWRRELLKAQLSPYRASGRKGSRVPASTIKVVGAAIAELASTASLYADVSTIATGAAKAVHERQPHASVSERTVRYALQALVEWGWLAVAKERAGRATIYRLTLPEPLQSLQGGLQVLQGGPAESADVVDKEERPYEDDEAVVVDENQLTIDDAAPRLVPGGGEPALPQELSRLIARFGSFSLSQLRMFTAAWEESPDGVTVVLRDAPNAKLAFTLIRDGEHRRRAAQLATEQVAVREARPRERASFCPDCETGGGNHTVDCPRAPRKGAVAS